MDIVDVEWPVRAHPPLHFRMIKYNNGFIIEKSSNPRASVESPSTPDRYSLYAAKRVGLNWCLNARIERVQTSNPGVDLPRPLSGSKQR
ncbi:hypothetical protein M427DRAFT_51622 [Gonapodya prolifera JEL478]|uniref:Uncharacterized protein n=1 Tax=Gonapodya prolifera (strain JEL478) TaxID=1344416 RepID=A0A139AXG9_GONPJ|nr:hypothetical protein M427DRAFT_51622 [Gonapodya prolifera JEL478]|eukprot:KXS21407.1 hypothetical protein M427DRAFT_51622 [Gonapodya prolifera JEL478]